MADDIHYGALISAFLRISEADTVIKCADGTINALSAILKARSPVFESILSGQFADAKIIDMSKYNVKVVNDFKNYIYTADTSELCGGYIVKELFDMYSLANYYLFSELEEFVKSNLKNAAEWGTYDVLEIYYARFVETNLLDDIRDLALETAYMKMQKGYKFEHEIIDISIIPEKIKKEVFDYVMRKQLMNVEEVD